MICECGEGDDAQMHHPFCRALWPRQTHERRDDDHEEPCAGADEGNSR